MDELQKEYARLMTRRHFFGLSSMGIGTAALASLMGGKAFAAGPDLSTGVGAHLQHLHFAPKAKR
ncbi:MAG: sulfatase, partial [Candidatus Omnitrophica bacterium]|nr:sulfatase [Candidatus Omnitrophota bacterium]